VVQVLKVDTKPFEEKTKELVARMQFSFEKKLETFQSENRELRLLLL